MTLRADTVYAKTINNQLREFREAHAPCRAAPLAPLWNPPEVETHPYVKFCPASERDRYKDAIQEALSELGVPSAETPAPIANAVEILTRALTDKQEA